MRTQIASFLILPALAAGACTDSTAPGAAACGEPTYYRIDQVHLPTTDAEARTIGFDLDRDRNALIDNALGGLNMTLRAHDPDFPDMNVVASERLAGPVRWLVARTECADGVHVEIGDSGGGNAVPLTALVDPLGAAQLAWVRPTVVRAETTVTGDALDGTIGFGIPIPGAQRAILAPMATYLTDELAAGTTTLGKIVDTNHDGVVTIDELLANGLVQTLVAGDIDPVNGVPTVMSAGMTIHATRVDL